ncbi:hypothetical protein CEXT_436431 [Caerostris extrusa]|uniref:Uncharacterized protein n=1 Tax=Caerostris extrusa TaxID=172846 RepID=A0AAV4QND0_CAEEX|nr:hypothetical protein CEXT_436431 [Caerostris extrusa]
MINAKFIIKIIAKFKFQLKLQSIIITHVAQPFVLEELSKQETIDSLSCRPSTKLSARHRFPHVNDNCRKRKKKKKETKLLYSSTTWGGRGME